MTVIFVYFQRESLVEDIAAPPQTTHPPINRDIPDAEAIFKVGLYPY